MYIQLAMKELYVKTTLRGLVDDSVVQCLLSKWKALHSISNHCKERKSNSIDFTSLQLEWLSLRTQTTTNVGEDVAKRSLYAVGGNGECQLVQPLWKTV
jgi:hypothetical protein